MMRVGRFGGALQVVAHENDTNFTEDFSAVISKAHAPKSTATEFWQWILCAPQICPAPDSCRCPSPSKLWRFDSKTRPRPHRPLSFARLPLKQNSLPQTRYPIPYDIREHGRPKLEDEGAQGGMGSNRVDFDPNPPCPANMFAPRRRNETPSLHGSRNARR